MSVPEHIVIAIDGPAASGKSTVARALAKRLGFDYVNTGAMYRAITWFIVSKGVPIPDTGRVQQLLHFADIRCGLVNGESTITIDGDDPAPHLVSEEVNVNVSAVSSIPEVRRLLVAKQRVYAGGSDVVMEGRDIGSVVFPDTEYKFYIDASAEIRALRRQRQGLQDSISARDKVDSTRRNSPLTIAEDAHVIDSSNLTIEGVVGEIIGRLKSKGLDVEHVWARR